MTQSMVPKIHFKALFLNHIKWFLLEGPADDARRVYKDISPLRWETPNQTQSLQGFCARWIFGLHMDLSFFSASAFKFYSFFLS